MTKILVFFLTFFNRNFIVALSNEMHCMKIRTIGCNQKKPGNSSPKNPKNTTPLLWSQKWAGDGTCVRNYTSCFVTSYLHLLIETPIINATQLLLPHFEQCGALRSSAGSPCPLTGGGCNFQVAGCRLQAKKR